MAGKGKSSGAGAGTREHPWHLKTPSGTSEFLAFRDETLDPPSLVVKSGSTELRYHLRCVNDLHSMLKSRGDWMLLGSADEQKPAAEGTIEAWGRSSKKSRGRLVWIEERAAREIRHVRAPGAGSSPLSRSRTQPEEQPDEGAVGSDSGRASMRWLEGA